MIEQIKPCPFCGSDEVEQFKKVNRIHDVKLLGYCCWNCGAESGIAGIEEEATRKWNRRPYDYDVPAIVKKVQRLEAAINQAITDCVPLLSWIDDDDTAVEMVEHLSEILGGALCKQPE